MTVGAHHAAPWITRVAAVSAAGWGVEALLDALVEGRPRVRPVPWDTPGLRSPFAALRSEEHHV